MQEQERKTVRGRDLYEWIQSLVGSVLVVVAIFTFGIRMLGVDGHSMLNTLQHGDRLMVVNPIFYHDYKYGDIVIAYKESFDAEPIVKRVIATEGQTLKIDFNTGDVYVDGVLLDEPYIKTPTTDNEGGEIPEVIPEGYVFVMGDNRGNSLDSRSEQIGLIDKRNIIGKAQYIVFPFDRIGGIG